MPSRRCRLHSPRCSRRGAASVRTSPTWPSARCACSASRPATSAATSRRRRPAACAAPMPHTLGARCGCRGSDGSTSTPRTGICPPTTTSRWRGDATTATSPRCAVSSSARRRAAAHRRRRGGPPVGSPPSHASSRAPSLAVTAATFAFFMYVGVLMPLVPRYIEDELRQRRAGHRPGDRRLRQRGDRRATADRSPRRPLRPPRRDDRRRRSRRGRRLGVRLRRLAARPARAARADGRRGGRPVRRRDDADRRPQPARSPRRGGVVLLRRRVRRHRPRTDRRRGDARARRGSAARSPSPGCSPSLPHSCRPPCRAEWRSRYPVSSDRRLRAGRRSAGCIPTPSAPESSWPSGWPPSPCSARSSRTTPGRSACPVRAGCSPCTAPCASCCASAAPGSPSGSGRELSVTTAFTMLGVGLGAARGDHRAVGVVRRRRVRRRRHGVHVPVADGVHRQPGTGGTNGRGRSPRSRCSSRPAPPSAASPSGRSPTSFGKRAGFAVAVGLCVVGVWVLRTIVIPASTGDRRQPMPAVAPLAAAGTDLH